MTRVSSSHLRVLASSATLSVPLIFFFDVKKIFLVNFLALSNILLLSVAINTSEASELIALLKTC